MFSSFFWSWYSSSWRRFIWDNGGGYWPGEATNFQKLFNFLFRKSRFTRHGWKYLWKMCFNFCSINFFVTFFCFQQNPDCLTSEARPNGKRGKERKVHPRTMPKPLTLLKSTNSSRNTARNETNHWYLLIHHVELLPILTPIQADLSKQNISLSEV